MDIVTLLVWVAVLVIAILAAFWIINQVPMDPKARQIINIVVVAAVAIIAIVVLMRFTGVNSLRL
jgi:chromate transport protein ChrA